MTLADLNFVIYPVINTVTLLQAVGVWLNSTCNRNSIGWEPFKLGILIIHHFLLIQKCPHSIVLFLCLPRLKHHNLEVVKTWETNYDKLSALNTFMVCGVLYMVNYKTLTIDHMFNTTSNVGTDVSGRRFFLKFFSVCTWVLLIAPLIYNNLSGLGLLYYRIPSWRAPAS